MNAELRPIVVIGAARSGTKILRDSLARALSLPAVPYDVGYVWRHGNESSPHDALLPGQIKPQTRRLVTSFFQRYATDDGSFIEKTVGNSLRVPFVAALMPRARYVHLIRDGVDVTESTRRQWVEPTDLKYLRDKAQHFPISLAPTYGLKFVRNQTVGRWRKGHVGTWGPRYPGIDEDLAADGLLTVAARQWRNSVLSARAAFDELGLPAVSVRYEDLIADPEATLIKVASALGQDVSRLQLEQAAGSIDSSVPRSGRAALSESERASITSELGVLLKELDYEQP